MGARKPTMGYPSRTAAVLALRGLGNTDQQIAEMIGIDRCTVSALACASKYKRPIDLMQRTVRIDNDVLDALRPAAQVRGISVNQLCRRILSTIADDNLVGAILDDET